jgi:hypothetical protein
MNTTEGNWMSLLREHSSDCEPDASVVTSNGMEKSGNAKTGRLVIAFLSWWNAVGVVEVHFNVDSLSRSDKGLGIVE